MLKLSFDLAGQYIDLGDPLDLVSEEFHADCSIRGCCRKDLHHIPADTEGTTLEIHLIPVILNVDQCPQDLIPIPLHTRPQRYHHLLKVLRLTQTIDAGYTGDDDHISPLNERRRCRQTQLIDLIIDRRILCYISIAGRHIRLRLIIIVIRNKIFHRIFRKELLHLSI